MVQIPVEGTKESEKLREIVTATESPPKGVFRFDDDSEFPPTKQDVIFSDAKLIGKDENFSGGVEIH
uniref:Uncharacterized protein n=1 Tax=Timema cristinae TaxID=61476 RepID=A0A7R9H1Z9_TIMCR|nr:unnamed protein product [Timema cristinae]